MHQHVLKKKKQYKQDPRSEPTRRHPQLLQLLQHLPNRPIQLASNSQLLRPRQSRIRLTQIPIHNRLHRHIITPPAQLIAAHQTRLTLLRAHVLLERRYKIDILLGHKRHQDTDRPMQTRVQQHLAPAGDEGDFVDRRDEVADVEVAKHLRFVGGTHELGFFVQDAGAGWVVVDLVGDFGVEPVDEDVSEAIGSGDGVVIHHCHG